MPYSGSGTFVPLPPPTFPAVTGAIISSTYFNNIINDLCAGLSNCVTKDGQGVPTGNLPMGGNKLTGLGLGSASGDSVNYSQLTAETTRAMAAETGNSTAITAETTRAEAAESTNATAISTETTNRIAGDAATLATANIDIANATPQSTQSVRGTVQLATTAQTNAGASGTLAVPPIALAASTFAPKAFAVFDGQTGGVATIKSSYGISSITRSSTGVYLVSFSNALPDTNYVVLITFNLVGVNVSSYYYSNKATSSFLLNTLNGGTTNPADATDISFAVFHV